MKIITSAMTRLASRKIAGSMKACSRPVMWITKAQSPEMVRPR